MHGHSEMWSQLQQMTDTSPALSDELVYALSALRRTVDHHALPMLMSSYRETIYTEHLLRLHLPGLPPDLAVLSRLLILGDEVEEASLQEVVEGEVLQSLVKYGIFSQRGEIYACRFKIVMAAGLLIFCEGFGAFAQAYFGQDSLALSRIIGDARGVGLDLCAGVGTHGLNMARTCERVVCVEANARLSKLFAINCVFNRLIGRRIQFHAVRVENFQTSNRFNWIVCNPPLLPVPSGIPFPQTADGGADGLLVIRTILQRLPIWLADDGEFRFVATMLGSESGPDLHLLHELAVANDLAIFLALPSRWRTSEGDLAFEAILQTALAYKQVPFITAYAEMRRFYKHPNRQWLYSVLGLVGHAKGKGSIKITRHFEFNRNFWHL